ncbi:MAG: hypothetical protein OEY88_09490 [Candidatus Bathyarchaeota archaeon]|nr:hypothetical protein [Candidatus Bathyarchaeota archaeon]
MNWKLGLILGFGAVMTIATMSSAVPLLGTFSQITASAKENVAKSIVGVTLSIGSLALAFLGYSLSQRRQLYGKESSRAYSRVAMVMYLLIPLCVFDALTSTTYLLTSSTCFGASYSWLFELALFLLFSIGGILIIATTYVVAEEFGY